MPKKVVDKETGFIKFIATPEEKEIRDLKKENENLKEAIKEIQNKLKKAKI